MRNFLLSTVTILLIPAVSSAASDFTTHTYTTPIELKPVSSIIGVKMAAVCFLGVGDCDPNIGISKGEDYAVDTAAQCLNEGFVKLDCSSVQSIDGVCPYNPAYGHGCKCSSNLVDCPSGQIGVGDSCDGKYTSCQCDPALLSCSVKEKGIGASCGGKYQACVCKPEYMYTSSDCTSPRFLSGDECAGKFTACDCPAGINNLPYGCEEYYQSPCSSVCKKAYADNCHNRSDNNSVIYGCMKFYDDCSSKCETPYKDNCRNRTDVIGNCPDNAVCTYFSDCSSKISSWSCNSGFKISGDSCLPERASCQIGWIYYSDNTCTSPEKHDDSKKVLGVVVYVNSGGVGGQIMAPRPIGEYPFGGFGTGGHENSASQNETNSCQLNDALNAKSPDPSFAPVHWAAREASDYAPTTATKGKWCLPGAGVLKNIANNLYYVQSAFSVIDEDFSDGVILSASIYGTDYAWGLNLTYQALVNTLSKKNYYNVQPVLEF